MPGIAGIIRSLPPLRSWWGPRSPNVKKPIVDLSSMLANFAGDLKGLPCEIVDEILEYLAGDLPALKACSLTCKVLLRSARRVIHRRLRIRGWVRSCPLDEHDIRAANLADFHPLLVAAKCGLTCYTRQLTINLGGNFHPKNLLPFLPQFQTLTRVTSLSLLYFHPTPFLPVFEQYFRHLAQQIQSLEFVGPRGSHHSLLYFISRFPNLDDLGLDLSNSYFPQGQDIPTILSSPTLRGTLRIKDARADGLLRAFKRLPSGLRFRSIEFRRCTSINPNIVIQECASTIQHLTHGIDYNSPLFDLDLTACSRLRIFEVHIDYPFFNFHVLTGWLTSTLSTITSPEFHRFVLVVDFEYHRVAFGSPNGQSASKLVDQAWFSLSQRTGMKLIVKGKGRALHSDFREVMEKAFPIMASAEMLEFEPDD